MTKKIKDLAVATGTYRNQFNEEKRRYMNCGAIMEGDDGGLFIMLNKYINYANIPSQGDSLLISAFDVKERDGGQQQQRREPDGSQGHAQQGGVADDLNDDIPF